jgi:hypothetical protein
MLCAAAGVVAAIALAGAADASAIRYASPRGKATNDCKTPATACDLTTAVQGVPANEPNANEEVVVEPGTYDVASTIKAGASPLNVHGAAGAARPLIKGSNVQIFQGTKLNLAHLAIEHLGSEFGVLLYESLLDGLLLRGKPSGHVLCECFGGTLRNSVIVALPESTTGAVGIVTNGGSYTETLRNDTIYSESEEGPAIQLDQQNPVGPEIALNAYNTIAINAFGGHDLVTTAHATITMHNSDYASPAGVVVDAGGHVTSPPLFTSVAAGNFGELPSSPTIDKGLTEEANGPLDFEGNARVSGAATDIGALEYQAPKAEPKPQPPTGPTPTPDARTRSDSSEHHKRQRVAAHVARRQQARADRRHAATDRHEVLLHPQRAGGRDLRVHPTGEGAHGETHMCSAAEERSSQAHLQAHRHARRALLHRPSGHEHGLLPGTHLGRQATPARNLHAHDHGDQRRRAAVEP